MAWRLQPRWVLFALVVLCAGGEVASLLTLPTHLGHGDGLNGDLLWAAGPLLGVLLAIGFLAVLGVLAILGNRRAFEAIKSRRLTVVSILVLLHIYGSMELLQVVIGDGHASGLHGFFDHGGWIVVPLVAVIATTVLVLLKTLTPLTMEWRLSRLVGICRPDCSSLSSREGPWITSDFSFRSEVVGRAPPALIV